MTYSNGILFAQWRKSNNGAPKLSDAEVITIALMQGYFGCATLSQTFALVQANAGKAFPHLCSYKQWLARLHAATPLLGLLVVVSSACPEGGGTLYLLDSLPIPLCHPLRHGRVQLLLVLWFQIARHRQSRRARGGRAADASQHE